MCNFEELTRQDVFSKVVRALRCLSLTAFNSISMYWRLFIIPLQYHPISSQAKVL